MGSLATILPDMVKALQTINQGIDGIEHAPQTLPSTINTADLPMAITLAGPGTWAKDAAAQGRIMLQRTYTIRVLVKPVVQGKGIDEGYNATLPLLQAVGNRYLFDITLGGLVSRTDTYADTGALEMQQNGNWYWAFEFSLRVYQRLALVDSSAKPIVPIGHIYASGSAGDLVVPP